MSIFKKNEDDPLWFIVFFTIATLAVIAIIGVFLVSLLSKEDVKKHDAAFNQLEDKNTSTQEKKSKQTKKAYQQKLKETRELLSKGDTSKKENLEKVEAFLFEVGVPKDFLDQHFQVAMEFRSNQDNLKKQNLETLKENLLQILSEL